MSRYYNPKRTSNLFDPSSKEPFRLSRSKIDLFLECPRCFYLDRRLGIARPPGYPFSLNSAVDKLLKKEFDFHRAKRSSHPLMKEYGLEAVPFQHEKMKEWRNNRKGVRYLHESANLLLTGAIDDIWANPQGELLVVEYKATSKNGEVSLDADWQISYKRQVEFYQWLLRKNGFEVSDDSYFVYCNGNTDLEAFDKKIEFDITLLPYKGDDSWVENAVLKAKECLMGDIPQASEDCDFCAYRRETSNVESSLAF